MNKLKVKMKQEVTNELFVLATFGCIIIWLDNDLEFMKQNLLNAKYVGNSIVVEYRRIEDDDWNFRYTKEQFDKIFTIEEE